jgi:hypothetical protein
VNKGLQPVIIFLLKHCRYRRVVFLPFSRQEGKVQACVVFLRFMVFIPGIAGNSFSDGLAKQL